MVIQASNEIWDWAWDERLSCGQLGDMLPQWS